MPFRKCQEDLAAKRYIAKARAFLFGLSMVLLTGFAFYFHLSFTPKVLQHLDLDRTLLAIPSVIYQSVLPAPLPAPKVHELPVYYINLNEQKVRRDYIRDHLRDQGFKEINRVAAWTLEEAQRFVKNDLTSIPNILKPNEKEIACLASHLYAMYLAVHDETNDSPYALIVEDDVSLRFKVDWHEMLKSAPADFSILQLTTSNSEAVSRLWAEYARKVTVDPSQPLSEGNLRGAKDLPSQSASFGQHQWEARQWDSALWSTQAYLIHKERLRERLDTYVSFNSEDHHYHIHLTNPAPSIFKCQGFFSGRCLMPFRIVADIMLYSIFPVTYMTRIPLFNGATAKVPAVSLSSASALTSSVESKEEALPVLTETSSIDEKSIKSHEVEFSRIETLINGIKSQLADLLPPFIQP